jgi:hypothetical protein
MANALIEKISTMVGQLEIKIWSEDLEHAINGHPEASIDKIKETLKSPSKVIQSKSSGNTCLFYSIENKISDIESLFFCVVVAVIANRNGKMITAYDADFMKTGKVLYCKK